MAAVGEQQTALSTPMPQSESQHGCSSNTVKFIVGGREFVVLREPTLSLHEGSLLKQLAEEAEDAESEPIHVEANAEYFLYVLDYHMHRKVYLPYTVSKEGVIDAANKLGITIRPDEIKQDMPTVGELTKLMKQGIAKTQEELGKKAGDEKCNLMVNHICTYVLHRIATTALVLQVEVGKEQLVELEGQSFTAVFEYLVAGLKSEDVMNRLRPWAKGLGYTVKLEQVKAVYQWGSQVYVCNDMTTERFVLDASFKLTFDVFPG